jgi:hypothetical protein
MSAAATRDRRTHIDCARLIRRLARRQESLRRRLSKLEEDADSLALDLTSLAEEVDGGIVAWAADRPQPLAPAASGAEARAALRRTAETGVVSVRLAPRSDGSADVAVDEGASFLLPPTLADLLSILASTRNTDPGDGLVGWKTIDEIARLLEKKSGRSFSVHAVTQQIYRLRRELFERGGINPWLVQTNRRLGARFALRARVRTTETAADK